jgi:hypothetical protein
MDLGFRSEAGLRKKPGFQGLAALTKSLSGSREPFCLTGLLVRDLYKLYGLV